MKKTLLASGLALAILLFPVSALASEVQPADTTVTTDSATGTTTDSSATDTTAADTTTNTTTDSAAGTAADTTTTDASTTDAQTTTTSATETPEETQEKIIANDSKPFLALGKDLTDDQLNYVLTEMGISKDDLDDYKVIYITNDEEHQYLDSYIDPSVIGSISLSCVMVKQNVEGYGIRVTTKNINYCTINMYKNALLTSGVENADVLVVGPYPISGTAALIGAWKAYEEMTGEELEEEAKTAALAEMITIGDLADELENVDTAKVEELIEYIKAEVIANGLDDKDDIKDVIKEAENKFEIDLTDEQIDELTDIMKQIADLDIDPKKLLEQAGDLYDKYGETVLSEAKAAIDGILTDEVKASLWDAIKQFFITLFNAIKNYVTGN